MGLSLKMLQHEFTSPLYLKRLYLNAPPYIHITSVSYEIVCLMRQHTYASPLYLVRQPLKCATLDTLLEDTEITVKKVIEKIRKLRPASAPEPDSIGAGFLQELQEELAPALVII